MADLDLPPDYVDLLRDFVAAGVDFLLIGGWAVAVHGHGRATDDMDVLVRAESKNAIRVVEALREYGAPLATHGVTSELFSQPRDGYRMGRKPIVIEILTCISGVTFEEASEGAVTVEIGGVSVRVIGRQALIKNKRAAGRPKDLADVEALEPDDDC